MRRDSCRCEISFLVLGLLNISFSLSREQKNALKHLDFQGNTKACEDKMSSINFHSLIFIQVDIFGLIARVHPGGHGSPLGYLPP